MKYAIETFDLTKRYGDFVAVDSLNMKVQDKSIFGFLGPNGAGKTTTIKMLTCLIQSTSGTAEVDGIDVNKDPNSVRTKIGMVPQLVSLYGDLTARENVELCADYYGIPKYEQAERIDDLMELVDIKYGENKLVKQMSGGQKQKVSVVASLIHRPDILFLDEPTIGLDPTTKMVLWDLIRDLNNEGHTIVLCSHDMYEVEMLCDHVGIMNQGKFVAFDTPQGLKDTLLKEKEASKGHKIDEVIAKFKDNESKCQTPSQDQGKAQIQVETQVQKSASNDVGGDISAIKDLKSLEKELNDLKSVVGVDNTIRQITVMIKNLNQTIIDEINKIPSVYKVDTSHVDRITVDVDQFDDNALNDVIWAIMQNNGNITSISTKDPSLEDVFISVTSKEVVNKID
ncbi:MAG: ATP-binding cassette domain-containing protein [Methanobacteriaceae archaeon]